MSQVIAALILAGGRARRMGGVDKGLQVLAGRPMLAWVLERIAPQVSEVMISANDTAKYAPFGLKIVADEIREAGPLAGMQAGLKATGCPYLVTVPCDAPFLPLELVSRLHAAARSANADVSVARTSQGRQPVFALLRPSVLPRLSDYIAAGGRKADGWYGQLQVAEVQFDVASAFANVNTAFELGMAEQALQQGRGQAIR